MYDISQAQPIKKENHIVGYLLQLNDETWLPLNVKGEALGPPSYYEDARTTLLGE